MAEGRCSESQLIAFMTDTGKSLAERYPRPVGSMKARANAGARLIKTFGGIPEVRSHNGTIVIRGTGCPLAALTSENPAACRVIEGLLTEYLGTPAKMCCTQEPEPRCCFEIAP
jgi:predicted ArsR family transcriptional regulator